MRYTMAVAAALASSAAAARASGQACVAPTNPLFEFQVDRPAAYVGDTTRTPRPARERFVRAREHPEVLVVQFVVDTAGVAEPRSFRVLQAPSTAAADSARAALPAWRFTPAVQRGCRVPQLVQTAITR